jgi:hypothetical protein
MGSKEMLAQNIEKFAVEPDRIETRQLDSTAAEAQSFYRSIEGQVALFSIDGGHTRMHTLNDLLAAETSLGEGGVVFLDDYLNADWPGVIEGRVDYLRGENRLVPVASGDRRVMSGPF